MPQKPSLPQKQQSALDKIAALDSLPKSDLIDLWRKCFGRDPFSAYRPVILPCLAYRIQEQIFGGLSKSAGTQLVSIADDIAAGRKPSSVPAARIKPGTRLIRSWQGEVHEVTVVEDGFLYRQTTYVSLSEIARLITGAHWSGPRFFGLNRPTDATGRVKGRS